MVFVDGENLAIRYGKMLKSSGVTPATHISYERDVFVWSAGLNHICLYGCVKRIHYYTSARGDGETFDKAMDELKRAGIQAPYVFKRTKDKGSKRVDIQLATDMLMHAARKNYETAVLVAGDEDYVPLVEAIKSEGRSVLVWFVSDGLSPLLKRSADHFANIDEVLFAPKVKPAWR